MLKCDKGRGGERTDELGREWAEEPAGDLGREHAGEPTTEHAGERADELGIEPAEEPADEWYMQSGEERAGELGGELAGERSSEPATEPSVELATEPAEELGKQPAPEPGTELAVESGRVWPQRRGVFRLEQTNFLLNRHLCGIPAPRPILQRCRIRPEGDVRCPGNGNTSICCGRAVPDHNFPAHPSARRPPRELQLPIQLKIDWTFE
jgi:hypothetical protein